MVVTFHGSCDVVVVVVVLEVNKFIEQLNSGFFKLSFCNAGNDLQIKINVTLEKRHSFIHSFSPLSLLTSVAFNKNKNSTMI